MKIKNVSRLILFILLNILYMIKIVVKSQEIGVDQNFLTGNGKESCQRYENMTRRYKKLENILNSLKSKCKEGFYAYSQDIYERPSPANKVCTVKNSKLIVRRLEYTEQLINLISDYCKTNDYRTSPTNAQEKTLVTEVMTAGTSVIPELKMSTTPFKLNDDTTTSPNTEDKTSATEGLTARSSVIPGLETSTPFSTTNSSYGYSFKLINLPWMDAIFNNAPGSEIWYPPLNSFHWHSLRYRTCFIKIGTVNANNNLLFRVVSKNNDSTVIGFHEKGLTDGATCIEYRCSVPNPDFTQIQEIDFYRHPLTYTLVRIIPIGQICSVSDESSSLRTLEQSNMGLSSIRSNIGKVIFEANIPDTENEGTYFHESNTFDGISEARNNAIKKCNTGTHTSYSDDMNPNIGLATTFTCL